MFPLRRPDQESERLLYHFPSTDCACSVLFGWRLVWAIGVRHGYHTPLFLRLSLGVAFDVPCNSQEACANVAL